MKKGYVFILTAMLILSMTLMVVKAEERQVKLDPRDLGVKFIAGGDAKPGDYFGDGIVNLRCAYTSGSGPREDYLWLASDWTKAIQGNPASLKIGNYKMAEIKKIEFDYTTDPRTTVANRVSLTKDAAGTQKLASVDITEGTSALSHNNTKKASMTINDTTYEGDMYLYIEYKTGESAVFRMFVANVTLTLENASEPGTEAGTGTGTEPGTNPPMENPSTGDTANLTVLAVAAVLGVLTAGKRKVGYKI